VLLMALTARCVFGRMSWLAHTEIFENPDPTLFQHSSGLWMLAASLAPALAIGIGLPRRVAIGAFIVEFTASIVAWVWNEHGFVPDGALFPYPRILLGVAEEVGIALVVAVTLAIIVGYAKRKVVALRFRIKSG
jgi:hypothetical protein